MSKLSQEDQKILSNLVMLLREVSKFSTKNCMTPRNLGICWAPTLFGGGAAGTEVVADLIDGYWHVFHNESTAPISPQLKKKPLPSLPSEPVQRRSEDRAAHLASPQSTPTSPKLTLSPRSTVVVTSPGRVKRPLTEVVIPPFIPPSQPLPPLPVKASPSASPRPNQTGTPNALNGAVSPRPRLQSSDAPPSPPRATKPKRHVKAATDVTN